MSKESLNDFYNLNRFNQKLRERVDSYEPELSDSLWDRIEHGLDRKENRSKRVLWVVYVLGTLLLLSSAGMIYFWDQNKKLADIPPYQFPEAIIINEPPAVERIVIEQNTAPVSSGSAAQAPVAAQAQTQTQTPAAAAGQSTPGLIISEGSGTMVLTPAGVQNTVTPVEVVPAEVPVSGVSNPFSPLASLSIEGKNAPAINLAQKSANGNFVLYPSKPDKDIYPRVQPFIGLTSEVGSTRQRLGGPDASKFGFERSMLYTAQGLRFGIQNRQGWSLSSGILTSSSGTNNWFGYIPAAKADTTPGIDPADSIVAGSNHLASKQYWIDIPLQVGYSYGLNSTWSLTGTIGLTYSIINSYYGHEPDPAFKAWVKQGSQEVQPFKNYFSLQLGTGIACQLGRNWQLSLEGQYRGGLGDMNKVQSQTYPKRRADFVGGQLGVRYIFR